SSSSNPSHGVRLRSMIATLGSSFVKRSRAVSDLTRATASDLLVPRGTQASSADRDRRQQAARSSDYRHRRLVALSATHPRLILRLNVIESIQGAAGRPTVDE